MVVVAQKSFRAARAWFQRVDGSSAHILLSVIFVLTRVALHAMGLRFNFIVDWMFLGDPSDLRERLLRTVYYFHAYPPGMNLVTGILLKLDGLLPAAMFAQAAFWIAGLVLVNSLLYLCRNFGLRNYVGLAICVTFSLLPQSLYFENLYLYEYPITALLCLAAAFFHRAARNHSPRGWFSFFLTCCVIAWIRSTYHLLWFVTMVALAVYASPRGKKRSTLLAAAAPATLLFALYLKNFALFGVFGAATSSGSNLVHVTVMQLPPDVRESWIQQGRLSPFARISVYASPTEYLPYFVSSESKRWPELSPLERPSVHAPNFNHWFFLEVNRWRTADALYYVRERPFEYLRTVAASFEQIFQPTTVWHPHDGKPDAPHYRHRQVLGAYEASYNRIVHGFPFAPVGLYLFLPLPFLWAVWRSVRLMRANTIETKALGSTLFFCSFQIAYVTVLSSFFTIGESSRYRYQVEPMIWLLVALATATFFARITRLWRAARDGRSLAPATTSSGHVESDTDLRRAATTSATK